MQSILATKEPTGPQFGVFMCMGRVNYNGFLFGITVLLWLQLLSRQQRCLQGRSWLSVLQNVHVEGHNWQIFFNSKIVNFISLMAWNFRKSHILLSDRCLQYLMPSDCMWVLSSQPYMYLTVEGVVRYITRNVYKITSNELWWSLNY